MLELDLRSSCLLALSFATQCSATLSSQALLRKAFGTLLSKVHRFAEGASTRTLALTLAKLELEQVVEFDEVTNWFAEGEHNWVLALA